MIGLDTNVLVRYMAQDDRKQSALATLLIEKELTAAQPGFISTVVLVELCWVLNSLYSASRDELVGMIDDLLNTPQFQLERREVVQGVIRRAKSGNGRQAGLADALIAGIASDEGCTATFTFDKAAVRQAGMSLLA